MFGSLTNGETRREAQIRNGRKDKRHILDFWIMFQCLSTCRVLEDVVTTLPRLERFLSEEQRPQRITGTVSDGRTDNIEQRGNLP